MWPRSPATSCAHGSPTAPSTIWPPRSSTATRPLPRQLDHPEHRARGARPYVFRYCDPPVGWLVPQRLVDVLEVVGLHVVAEAAGLVELLFRVLELHAHH